MNNDISIEEYKIQASMLLKALRSNDSDAVEKALTRFQSLSELQKSSAEEIISKAKLKHALAVIADEQGFDSWADLKSFCTKQVTESFVDGYEGGFLNQWFIAYSEARDYQKTKGGFLLPYKKQFFVCEAEYIDWLGLDSDDPDWKAIDYDWVKPSSQKAYARLSKKWKSILGGRDE